MSTFNLFQKLVVGLVAVFNGGWHPAPPTRRVEMVRCESQSGWVGEEGGDHSGTGEGYSREGGRLIITKEQQVTP